MKTKFVVGDVVVYDGRQYVILGVSSSSWELYNSYTLYLLSNGEWMHEDDINCFS